MNDINSLKRLLQSLSINLKDIIHNHDTRILDEKGKRIGVSYQIEAFEKWMITSKDESNENLDNWRIESLNLSGMGIKSLPKNTFSGFSTLRKLNLSNNKLETLHENTFSEFSTLKELNLSNNKLETLPDRIFNNISIESLDLNNNKFPTFPNEIFDRIIGLKELRIECQTLEHLSSGFFSDLNQLELLSIANSQNLILHVDLFNGLSSLKELSMARMKINELPCGIFDPLSKLEYLYLHENDIESLPDGIFVKLENLSRLHLNHNKFKTLPPGIFDTLINLKLLYLNNNNIKRLPSNLFKNNTKLQTIILDNNELKNIPEPSYLKNLLKISIKNNPLNELPPSLIFLPRLRSIYAYITQQLPHGINPIEIHRSPELRNKLTRPLENEFLQYLDLGYVKRSLFKWWHKKNPDLLFEMIVKYASSNSKTGKYIPWEEIFEHLSQKQLAHLRLVATGEFSQFLTNYLDNKVSKKKISKNTDIQ